MRSKKEVEATILDAVQQAFWLSKDREILERLFAQSPYNPYHPKTYYDALEEWEKDKSPLDVIQLLQPTFDRYTATKEGKRWMRDLYESWD